MHLSTPRLVPSVSRFEYKVEAANRIFRMVTPDDFSQFKLSEKNRTLLRALRNLCTPDINDFKQKNYNSSILTANMLLLTLQSILLISICFLIAFVALKGKHFLKDIVKKGVVIEDVRTIKDEVPLKPKRSNVNERLVK